MGDTALWPVPTDDTEGVGRNVQGRRLIRCHALFVFMGIKQKKE